MKILRVALFYALFLLLSIVAVVRIIDLQFIHKPAKEQIIAPTQREIVIPCKRGGILATDGRYLAFSIAEYRIFLDCVQSPDSIFTANVNALASALAEFPAETSAAAYRKLLNTGRSQGKRYLRLTKKEISYEQMKLISSYPLLKLGKGKGGLIVEPYYNQREYPYGSLAYRVLGRTGNTEVSGVGIEASCDSLLRGTDGRRIIRKTEHHRWIEDVTGDNVEPVDGLDVRTTIDIEIQEFAETALRRQLAKSNDIKYGTVIVMETSTGCIRAMVNLEKDKNGTYRERYNNAIAGAGEPGSVFKLATLTLLLDEGRVTLNTILNPAPSVIQCGKAKPMKDDYLSKYSSITVCRGFEISSNNVFRKLAWDNWKDNPTAFVDSLNDKIRITADFPFELEGLRKARIKHPSERNSRGQRTWSDSDLPQIAMGYTSTITPLHTINFYNAIANGGVMVRPHLVESIEKDGAVIRSFPTEVIGRVCKKETADTLHKAMRRVVTEEGATGHRVFEGCRVNIAGKTGTARVGYGKGGSLKQHQATFAGFFPYENPKYSIIAVLYSNPSNKNYYGATWSGPVVREIAENIYASRPDWKEAVRCTADLPDPDAKIGQMTGETTETL